MGWSKTGRFGLRLATIILPVIGAVETLAQTIPGLKGKAKEDAVVAAVRVGDAAVDTVVGKELLSDTTVESATRSFIQAFVSLQNALAEVRALKAPAQQPPTP